ncbi:hypothetical protein [Fredinandcohnia sp. 179-A 10B2 NHS]|uniref:hypothetical protein n=1 Tax=Fredinandcohnia sp. 179-A 10B2 NHS TaxID=3235176 RepID=UPI0039A1F533
MEIKERSNLVISTFFFSLAAYHDSCYSRSLKGIKTAFVGNEPINGFSGNLKAIIAAVIAIILLLTNSSYSILGFIVLLIPLIRIYAWFIIERHLK